MIAEETQRTRKKLAKTRSENSCLCTTKVKLKAPAQLQGRETAFFRRWKRIAEQLALHRKGFEKETAGFILTGFSTGRNLLADEIANVKQINEYVAGPCTVLIATLKRDVPEDSNTFRRRRYLIRSRKCNVNTTNSWKVKTICYWAKGGLGRFRPAVLKESSILLTRAALALACSVAVDQGERIERKEEKREIIEQARTIGYQAGRAITAC